MANDANHQAALDATGHWGKRGAGAIILARRTGRILLPFRSLAVTEPLTYGTWGGAVDDGEDERTAVLREIAEETGSESVVQLEQLFVYESPKGDFVYKTFLAIVADEFKPTLNWESVSFKWTTVDEMRHRVPAKFLHFGLKAILQNWECQAKIAHLSPHFMYRD